MVVRIALLLGMISCVWSQCGHFALNGTNFNVAGAWDTCHPSWTGNRTHHSTRYLINTCNSTDNTGTIWSSDNINCTNRVAIAGPFAVGGDTFGYASLGITHVECNSSIEEDCFAFGIRSFNDIDSCTDAPMGKDVDPYLADYCVNLWTESIIYNCTDQTVSVYSELDCIVTDLQRTTSFIEWAQECQANLVPNKGGYVQETVICGWGGVLEEWAATFPTTSPTDNPSAAPTAQTDQSHQSPQLFFCLFISFLFTLNN